MKTTGALIAERTGRARWFWLSLVAFVGVYALAVVLPAPWSWPLWAAWGAVVAWDWTAWTVTGVRWLIARRRRPTETEALADEIRAVVALASASGGTAHVEGPGGRVVFAPYACEGLPCEPDDGGEVQPDGTRTFQCLWCTNTWTVS